MSDSLFRAQALGAQCRLDALSSTMRVTGTRTRLALGALAIALVGGSIASAHVNVPIRVAAQGLLVDASDQLLVPMRSTAAGMVDSILVRHGQKVIVGQPLVRLRLPEKQAARDKIRRDLEVAEANVNRTIALQAEEQAADTRTLRAKQRNLDEKMLDIAQRLGWAKQREAALEELHEKGVVIRLKVQEVSATVLELTELLATTRTERDGIDSQIVEADGRRERELRGQRMQIEQLRNEGLAIEADIVRNDVVRSTAAGAITEVLVDGGGLLTYGQPVANVLHDREGVNSALESIVFVPMKDGKRLNPGDEVLLTPASLPSAVHDRLKAHVVEISDVPTTQAAMVRMLGSAALAEAAGRQGPVFTVRVRLTPDTTAASGYRWTSGGGPKVRLTPGTPVTAQVIVERTPLLALAVTALRDLLKDTGAKRGGGIS